VQEKSAVCVNNMYMNVAVVWEESVGNHSKIISGKVLSRLDKEAKASVCNVIYYKNLPSTVIQEKSLEIGQDWS
jgi:hypothetical protein